MKRAFAAAALLAAAVSPAMAADPTVAPGWAGVYGGLVGGFGTGHSDQTDPGAVPIPVAVLIALDGHYALSGGMIGATLGSNWQQGGWIYGLEGDLSWANLSGQSQTCGNGAAPLHPCGTKLDALGTFRGRIGHVVGASNSWLLYATGGLAVGEIKGWDSLGPTSGSDWRAGWTVGAGVETMFAPQWTARLEYLHVDLGKAAMFNSLPGVSESVTLTSDIVRAGINYRFGTPAPAPRLITKAPVLASHGGWSGWYVGVNAGYLDGSDRVNTDAVVLANSTTATTAPTMAAAATSSLSTGNGGGFIGGAQAGYNVMVSPMLLAGVELDLQGSRLSRTGTAANTLPVPLFFPGAGSFTTNITASRGLDYIGTVRGRLGATVTPNLLLYVTGGLAYGGVKSSTSITQTGSAATAAPTVSTAGSFSDNRAGYTVGAGGEWMILGKWSVKGEYLYYDLGSATYGTGGYGIDEGLTNLPGFNVAGIATSTRVRFNGNIARIGLNYHLN